MRRYAIVLAVVLLSIPVVAVTLTILPDVDLLQTRATAAWDFASEPIPAGFFGPGSDPFDGIINFIGEPLVTSPWVGPTELGYVDTIILRQDTIAVPTVPSTDLVPIEIVALNLVSVSPITVTFNNGLNPELWDVDLTLSPTPSGPGQMDVDRTHLDGGTFDMVIPVIPKFIFTRQSDNATEELDGASSGHSDVWQANGVLWQSPAPGVLCSEFASSYAFDAPQPSQFNGANASVPFTNGCLPTSGIPTLSEWAMIVMVLILMLTATAVMVRRRAARS